MFSGKNIKNILLPAFVCIFLFILPFFWLDSNTYDIGGDDTRLYYLFPEYWLKNQVSNSWTSPCGLSLYYPLFHAYLTLTRFLTFLKTNLPFVNRQSFAYGVIFVTGFLSVYSTVRLIINFDNRNCKTTKKITTSWAPLLGGLFYIFTPLSYFWWRNPLANVFDLAVLPMMFFFFLKAVFLSNHVYLIYGALASLFFTSGFKEYPYCFSYLLGFFLFGCFFVLTRKDFRVLFIKYSLFFLILIILVHGFWLFPLIGSILEGDSILTRGIHDASVSTVSMEWKDMNIVDTLMGLLSRKFKEIHNVYYVGQDANIFGLIVPFITFSVILYRKKNKTETDKAFVLYGTYVIFLLVTLVFAFLSTVNITELGHVFYNFLMRNVYGFGMFRTFWSKFPTPYIYFYALAFGLAICQHEQRIEKKSVTIVLLIALTFYLIFQGMPLLTGKPIKVPWVKYGTLTSNVKFPKAYLKTVGCLSGRESGRVISVPFAFGGYNFVNSIDNKGIYVGNSPVRLFANRDNFNGAMSFSSLGGDYLKSFMEIFQEGNYTQIEKILSFLDIKYLLYNTNMLSERTPESFRRGWIWGYPDIMNENYLDSLLDHLAAKKICESGGYVLYETNSVSKRVFIPESTMVLDKSNVGINEILDIASSTDRVFVSKNKHNFEGKNGFSHKPDVKILNSSPGKYEVEVSGVGSGFVIVLLERYHNQWGAELVSNEGNVIKSIPDKYHFRANDLFNGWFIPKPEGLERLQYDIFFTFKPQKYFHYGLIISIVSIILLIMYLLFYLLRLNKGVTGG